MVEAFKVEFSKRVNVEPQTYAITVYINPDYKSVWDKVSDQFSEFLDTLVDQMERM